MHHYRTRKTMPAVYLMDINAASIQQCISCYTSQDKETTFDLGIYIAQCNTLMKLIVLSTENKTRTENVSVFWVYFLYNCCSTLPPPQMVVVVR